jgi:hypothetical protein
MKTIAEYGFKMPSFLLSAIYNGDFSGMTDADIRTYNRVEQKADDLMNKNKGSSYVWGMIDPEQEPYFTWSPDFIKLGCDVVDMQLVIF